MRAITGSLGICVLALCVLTGRAFAQDLTPEMRADIDRRINFQLNWDMKLNSPGARLSGLEKAHEKPGEGEVVVYEFRAQGLPADIDYSLFMVPTMGSRAEDVTSTGKVSIEEKSGRVINGPNDPRTVIIPDPAPGEPYRFALISNDQKYKGSVTLLPKPVGAKHRGCEVTILRLTRNFELALVELNGFPADTDIEFKGNSEGEIHNGQLKTDAGGAAHTAILPFKAGKSKGKIELQFHAPDCSPKLSFKWGSTEQGLPYE